ncbi:DUF421 domain-containing protein [Cytobacillus spongiae]|uniref:DUF421 domain-containing protein n=1 Tax=Cytobacillus spongiae TaxID=2901381 RepID=UPI001F38F280|nr:YetF domain-containing protein [Cytobacillus spongiae]UII57718.1 DUF421 domain-containing protein [Cytobacillus spongiae]
MPGWLQALIYLLSALILLRIGGKRSFSQMTPSEVVVMIGIGTVLVHPLKSDSSLTSVYHGALIIGGLLIISWVQLYVPRTKRWLMGEPILLIQDGQIIHENLRKTRMPEDELKMMLRLNQVNDLTKVKSASLEVSGELGIEMRSSEEPATKKDIEELKALFQALQATQSHPAFPPAAQNSNQNLFHQVQEVQHHDPLQ